VSIVLQSLPFVLVGVFASAFVQQHLTGQMVVRWMPRRPLAAVVMSSLVGLVVPVCDCGVIPLARRLTARGVPVYAATSFLVAAPVVNPVVLLSTAFAFQGNPGVVVLRLGMTWSVAVAVGLLARALLPTARSGLPSLTTSLNGDKDEGAARPGLIALVHHATAEYFDVIFFIILGALFTAATQTFVPRGDLAAFGSQQLSSVLALMPVATLLSICSEADAFVARAFATTFSLGAVLAFMTIGQIVDLRNGPLLWRTLGARVLLLIVLVAYPLVFAESVLINRLVAA
jgi:uncharacterized protein